MAQPLRLRKIIDEGRARLNLKRAIEFRDALAGVDCYVSLQTCWNWQNGEGVDPKHFPALAKLFGIPLAEIVLAAAGLDGDGNDAAAAG